MVKSKGNIFIGTSGFHYNHWVSSFYPKELKKKDWLNYYQKYFNTLEINNSFYRLPPPETFVNWRQSVFDNFIFSVKGSRFITHNKKLKEPADALNRLFESCKHLENKLGPILFQLPPTWKCNTERLREFIKMLPQHYRYTIEFRNQTWYNQEVYDLLSENNISFCIYHLEKHLSPIIVTADFAYIRLHGPANKYSGLYDMKTLKDWGAKITDWAKSGKDVYIYFDNDEKGYATKNAIQLRKITENVKIELTV